MPLARHMYLRHRPEHTQIPTLFSEETVAALMQHPWPGNVRELANVIEHATILCEHPPILPDHLPRHFIDRRLRKDVRSGVHSTPLVSTPMSLRELEALAVQEAVNRHGGNKPAAAEELGISLKTLYNKLNQADPANKKAA